MYGITTPDGGPFTAARQPDAQNPAAQRYAFQQLKRYGVPIPPGTDPAAAWRAASANIFGGQPQAPPQFAQAQQPGLADLIRRALEQGGQSINVGAARYPRVPSRDVVQSLSGPPADALARAAANARNRY